MVTAVERLPVDGSAALAFGSGLRTPYERALSIDEIFAEMARLHPSAFAVMSYDSSLTLEGCRFFGQPGGHIAMACR